MEQVKHAVKTGAMRPGEQLPAIRKLAEDLVMNSNTVMRAYRELEHEGIVELRHGLGAFTSELVEEHGKLMRRRRRCRRRWNACEGWALLRKRSGDCSKMSSPRCRRRT